MRISVIWMALLLVVLASPARGQAPNGWPMVSSVEPDSGKPGELIVARGNNLGSDKIAAVYLTDGKTDTKVEIVEQSATIVKFKIPREAQPGRLALMVLTKSENPRLIEEPVKITVEPATGTFH